MTGIANIEPARGAPEPVAAVQTLQDRVREEVLMYFPEYKERGLTDPPHADAYHQGLLQLRLALPQAGQDDDRRRQLADDNRRKVYDYTVQFSADAGERVYTTMIDMAMALVRSRELAAAGGATQQSEALQHSLNGALTGVFGANNLFKTGFLQAMMLGDDQFDLDMDW